MDEKTTQTLSDEGAKALADACENRQHVYGFLSRLFEREVDEQLVGECGEGWSIAFDDQALNAAFEKVRADLAACDAPGIEDAAVDFDRVFFGMGPLAAEKAFPYESVYTSERGLMMQDAYSSVVVEYRNAGFAKNPAFTEPEDHIAVELAYMALLCGRAAEALESGDASAAEAELRSQQAFLKAHLLPWVGRFAADVKNAAQLALYADVAECAEAFLAADAAWLGEVIE